MMVNRGFLWRGEIWWQGFELPWRVRSFSSPGMQRRYVLRRRERQRGTMLRTSLGRLFAVDDFAACETVDVVKVPERDVDDHKARDYGEEN